MISSPLLASAYERQLPDYDAYENRSVADIIPANDSEPPSAARAID
jgi:hypothetical protein